MMRGCWMRRVFHPYWDWEDYREGLFDTSDNPDRDEQSAAELLANPIGLSEAMRDACLAFPNSAEHNLTSDTGRRAWLGQAACFHRHGVPASSTRLAWWRNLSDSERAEANTVADQVCLWWEGTRAETLFT